MFLENAHLGANCDYADSFRGYLSDRGLFQDRTIKSKCLYVEPFTNCRVVARRDGGALLEDELH